MDKKLLVRPNITWRELGVENINEHTCLHDLTQWNANGFPEFRFSVGILEKEAQMVYSYTYTNKRLPTLSKCFLR